jgi:predicted esterase
VTTTLLCLHGFSQNGPALREQMQDLLPRLPTALVLDFPDGPHECSPESVERLQRFLRGAHLPPPHRCYWDATDDGRVYRGWEASLDLLRERVRGVQRLGVLGFSQGAGVSAALCALAARHEFPKIEFAVLIAGRRPRADAMQSLFAQPLDTPSLHVWGERDAIANEHSPILVEHFTASQRQVVQWPGSHNVPTRGPASDVIVDFITAHTA